ncbi:MAG: DinB family protein [Acidobacteria bacterium]|nr:DinB family protein [Acidobacteriota bacterium]
MSALSPEHAKVIGNFFLQSIKQELEITKKVLAAVPDDKSSYKPEPKAKTAHELAWHIATADIWFFDGILAGEFTMGDEPPAPKTIAEIVNHYETNMRDRISKLAELPAEKLAKVISFFGMEFPAVVYLSFLTHHTAHHRGQLSTYLRPMGSKVPSIYGGSADEPFQMEAKA